jgi:hypothetical protein
LCKTNNIPVIELLCNFGAITGIDSGNDCTVLITYLGNHCMLRIDGLDTILLWII